MTETTLISSKVFVTGVQVQAEIGVYRHEIGRVQPLIVDVELDIPTDASDRLADTFNYEAILKAAQDLAAQGHVDLDVDLVETFAHRLAARCLADPRVTRARVRIEKPLALAPHAVAAGVEIVLGRG
jgi:7,8-dihydroneopterin aldolase/epimerase/oxygenase